MPNELFYGDNLEVLRRYIRDETIDLCYIDPPFNSKRTYNQIYNNVGTEDRAQAQAFIDTWVWDDVADQGFTEILSNDKGRFSPRAVDLLSGLQKVLKKGNLLAYLVSMALRITEIHRVLKPTGSFYLHCDPTASHYLKILIDTIFVRDGGDWHNEVVWYYKTGGMSKRWFGRKHDLIFFYSKGKDYTFLPQTEKSFLSHKYGFSNIEIKTGACPYAHADGKTHEAYYTEVGMRDVWDIPALRGNQPEALGYPTQKPISLLKRVIEASSRPGETVLDAYCGCGTTVAAAQELGRKWIGIDITYQAISVILHRLEGLYGKPVVDSVTLSGIPQDIESAKALALKKDDRVRKEFEKWAVLTYTANRAVINDKKGADAGIDGIAFFLATASENAKVVFQAKSGGVNRGDISKFNNDRVREGAELGVFLTLEHPTRPMIEEARAAGNWDHPLMGRRYPRIQIVTIEEVLAHKRLDVPLSYDVLKKAVPTEAAHPELFEE